MRYMDRRIGAWQIGADPDRGAVQFTIFYPSGLDPHVTSIRVAGSFQSQLGQIAWDWTVAPHMTRSEDSEGALWTYTTPIELSSGFYEYKYLVSFDGGETRWVSDPCTRYGGSENQNAAIAVGGTFPSVRPLRNGRKPQRDLIIYELHLDDFTD